MQVDISGDLGIAIDSLGMAELAITEALVKVDAEAGGTDRSLMLALEDIALARVKVEFRNSAYARAATKQKSEPQRERKVTPRKQVEEKTTSEPVSASRLREVMKRAGADEKAIEATVSSPGVAFQDQLNEATALPEPQPISVPELAAELGISQSEMHRWVRIGRLKTRPAKKGKRGRLVDPHDVDMLRSLAATRPADRKSVAAWVGKALQRSGRP